MHAIKTILIYSQMLRFNISLTSICSILIAIELVALAGSYTHALFIYIFGSLSIEHALLETSSYYSNIRRTIAIASQLMELRLRLYKENYSYI